MQALLQLLRICRQRFHHLVVLLLPHLCLVVKDVVQLRQLSVNDRSESVRSKGKGAGRGEEKVKGRTGEGEKVGTHAVGVYVCTTRGGGIILLVGWNADQWFRIRGSGSGI